MVQRDSLAPILVEAQVSDTAESVRVHFAPVWGIPDMGAARCTKPVIYSAKPPRFVMLNPCQYFLFDPKLAANHTIRELVAEHEAIVFRARFLCRVNDSTEPGAPPCSEIRSLDHTIAVNPEDAKLCSY